MYYYPKETRPSVPPCFYQGSLCPAAPSAWHGDAGLVSRPAPGALWGEWVRLGVLSIQEVDVLARRRYWGLVLVSPKWSSDLPIMGSGVRWRDGSPPPGGVTLAKHILTASQSECFMDFRRTCPMQGLPRGFLRFGQAVVALAPGFCAIPHIMSPSSSPLPLREA